jgi:hypothetical protein
LENFSHGQLQLPALLLDTIDSKGETRLATNEAIARYDRTSLLSWQYSFDWRVSNVFSYNGPKASGIAFSIFVISLHKFVIFLFSFLVFY